MDDFSSPILPKGRGEWISAINNSRDVGRSTAMPDGYADTGLGQSQSYTPTSVSTGEGPHTSTPGSDVDAIHHLTDMVGQLGAQIGESIVAKLMSAGVVSLNSGNHIASVTENTPSDATRHDVPQVTVRVKPDREPQTFRGDSTDKNSVQDWIDMTKTYLRKQDVPIQEQAEEIISHLMGKARDVVKIALRSNPALDVRQKPELVYDILLQYFSDASSCLPLADFYATLPKHKENPVDYWIRLNKAADQANEGLRRQGKQTEDMADDVALMFVKHCPDPELTSILKCKPVHEWNSRDVQTRIDDYQRELRASSSTASASQLKSHTASVAPEQSTPAVSEQHHTLCPSSASETIQGESRPAQNYAPVPAVAQNLQQSEDRLLTRVADMFQEMMERMQQRSINRPTRGGRFQYNPRDRRSREAFCRVCNDSSHTTTSHCMGERLCFGCYAPGHTRPNCPAKSFSPPHAAGN